MSILATLGAGLFSAGKALIGGILSSNTAKQLAVKAVQHIVPKIASWGIDKVASKIDQIRNKSDFAKGVIDTAKVALHQTAQEKKLLALNNKPKQGVPLNNDHQKHFADRMAGVGRIYEKKAQVNIPVQAGGNISASYAVGHQDGINHAMGVPAESYAGGGTTDTTGDAVMRDAVETLRDPVNNAMTRKRFPEQ